jgi:hypothetical protein
MTPISVMHLSQNFNGWDSFVLQLNFNYHIDLDRSPPNQPIPQNYVVPKSWLSLG